MGTRRSAAQLTPQQRDAIRRCRRVISLFKAVVFAPAVLCLIAGGAQGTAAADYKPINLHPDYDHDHFVTRVTGTAGQTNYTRHFRAYTTVFDGEDDGLEFSNDHVSRSLLFHK